jgi:hypothetical protein
MDFKMISYRANLFDSIRKQTFFNGEPKIGDIFWDGKNIHIYLCELNDHNWTWVHYLYSKDLKNYSYLSNDEKPQNLKNYRLIGNVYKLKNIESRRDSTFGLASFPGFSDFIAWLNLNEDKNLKEQDILNKIKELPFMIWAAKTPNRYEEIK